MIGMKKLLWLALALAIAPMAFAQETAADTATAAYEQVLRAYEQVVAANAAEREVQRYAGWMRQSTTELTRMVRLYALTGEQRYRDYFDEILAIRNGEAPRPELYDEQENYWLRLLATGQRQGEMGTAIALKALLRDSGFPETEIALLEESEANSNALAQVENEVMAGIEAQLADGGEYVLTGETLSAAMRLFDQAYHELKLQILEPLSRLQAASLARVQALHDDAQALVEAAKAAMN